VGQGPVRALVIVDGGERAEEGLELAEGGGLGCLGGEPALECLLEPFHLALGLRVVRLAVLLGDPEAAQFVLEAVAAALATGQPVVNTIPLSVNVAAGGPCSRTAARKVASTTGPVTRCQAVTDRA
jgi:hypothetical protein